LEVVAIVTNRTDAGVLIVAEEFGIPSHVMPLRQDVPNSRLEQESRIHTVLSQYQWDYLVLAGYMRILTSDFVGRYPHPEWPVSRILNIHPSMLPDFKGATAYEDAFDAGVLSSGITVHFVSPVVDDGLILVQESVVRKPEDTLELFRTRGLAVEHRLYSRVLLDLAMGRYQTEFNPFSIQIASNSG
jgi:phosphoribosylglycinamide formyltransferase-1